MALKVSIVGGSGYTGGELLRILARHSRVEIAHCTSRKNKGEKVYRLHSNLRGFLDLAFEDVAIEEIARDSDAVFLATPHGASMEHVKKLFEINYKGKIIDLSGDFRFKDTATYEKYYKNKHIAPEIKAVYGLPELHREEIKKAKLVANPGCYATAGILGAAPILKYSFAESDKIVIDAKSGVSGAGAEPNERVHFCSVNEEFTAYNTAKHRHMPEIEQEVRAFDKSAKIAFVPHLAPWNRGISATIHIFLKKKAGSEEIKKAYEEFYGKEKFVRILNAGETPKLSSVRGTNFIDIGCFEVDEERKRAVIVAALDNLAKGASAQAVQNMNLMFNLAEDEGLENIGLYP